MQSNMKIVSLFTGAWGLDLGFHQAGFDIIWANEFDKSIWKTFKHNFPNTELDWRSIVNVPSFDVPDSIWIVWGPPCQSWSEAWAWRWISDKRWQLFYEYIRLLKDKKPLFFLAENVSGILQPKHKNAFESILDEFRSLDYNVTYYLLNANDYWVPQDRKRVIIVWYHKKMNMKFSPPQEIHPKQTIKNAIWDLRQAKPAKDRNYTNGEKNLHVANHEYMIGWFSSMYMSRNRVRSWDEPSFTIQAGGRHAPIHPQAPKMKFVEQNVRIFIPGKEDLYRRLSVRECARVQTFPDNFLFKYTSVTDWYKMIGNAVPVVFAKHLASVIYKDVLEYLNTMQSKHRRFTNNEIRIENIKIEEKELVNINN